MYKLKRDIYKSARGGHSRLLAISCGSCQRFVCHYQKDGPGLLKRMYVDRIIGEVRHGDNLTCPDCGTVIGIATVYEKENRPAYRLFVGSFTKKVVSTAALV